MKKSSESRYQFLSVLLMFAFFFVVLPICIVPQCLVEDVKTLDNGMPFWYLFIPAIVIIISVVSILFYEEYYC